MHMVLWTMQIGVAGMFCMAGGRKLSGSEYMVQLFQALGLGQGLRYFTGFLEVGGAVLLGLHSWEEVFHGDAEGGGAGSLGQERSGWLCCRCSKAARNTATS